VKVRFHRRCRICGSPHGRNVCPVWEYNAELEARDKERITAEMLFPGKPGLIALLKSVQERWITSRV